MERLRGVSPNEFESGEQALWSFVLATYTSDLRSLMRSGRYDKAQELLAYAENEWTEFLCDAAGIDHALFTERLNRLYRDLIVH